MKNNKETYYVVFDETREYGVIFRDLQDAQLAAGLRRPSVMELMLPDHFYENYTNEGEYPFEITKVEIENEKT